MQIEIVLERLQAASIAEGVDAVSMLNFVVSDGYTMVATRVVRQKSSAADGEYSPGASLYFASGNQFECVDTEAGCYRMVHADRRTNLAIVASEPLTRDPNDWVPVPQNHVIVITDDMQILMSPIGMGDEPYGIGASLAMHASARRAAGREQQTDGGPATLRGAVSHLRGSSESPLPSPNKQAQRHARHALRGHTDTVLSLVCCGSLVFSGSQDSLLRVWDPHEYKCVASLAGHERGILSLATAECASGNGIVVSAGSDSTVRLWQATAPFTCHRVVSFPSMGDIMSLSVVNDRVFCGFQDTALRYFSLNLSPRSSRRSSAGTEMATASGTDVERFAEEDSTQAPMCAARPRPRAPSFVSDLSVASGVQHVR